MPTYEYICEKCGHTFETVQSISAKPLGVCPEELCSQKKWGKGKVKRAISGGSGLIFKGSGFYITDYRSEGYKAAAKKESTSASTPSTNGNASGSTKSDSGAKKESKPATTPPGKT